MHGTVQQLPSQGQFGSSLEGGHTSSLARDLRFALESIYSNGPLILGTVAAGLFLALAYIWITPPKYTAVAQILIDPRKREILKQEIVSTSLGTSSLGADVFLLDSQVEIMTSAGVLRQLVEKESLDSDPEFAGRADGIVAGAKSMALAIIRGPFSDHTSISQVDRAMEKLVNNLKVHREGNTYLISVKVITGDAEKSARLANSLTEIYVAETNEAFRSRVQEAERLLSSRLAELGQRALAAQQKAELFRIENGLIGAQNLPVVEQQLRDLNQQYTLAIAETSRARARLEEVKRLRTMPVEMAIGSSSLQSPLLATLRQQFSELSAREAALSTSLRPRHPNVIAAREALTAVRRAISQEVERLITSITADVTAAEVNEATIRGRLASAEGRTGDVKQASARLSEFEQEATAASGIYQDFLRRSKDAREQIALQSDSVRVVSSAVAPTRASWPKEPLLLAAAAVIGLLIGLMLAVFAHLLRGQPFEAQHARQEL
jgi:polysaccharide biosynthesis transport protein